MNTYLLIIGIVLIIGLVVSYQSEIESQDCTKFCTHWVHNDKSRWRQNINLDPYEVTQERLGLFYSAVEWRRSLLATIVITIPICIFFTVCYSQTCEVLKLFIISFVYVFIVIFFIGMYYQEMWKHVLHH